MNDNDIQQAENTFRGFFDSLGPNDIYKKIFLEVLLEELYGQPVDLSDVVNWEQMQSPPIVQKPFSQNRSS